MMNLLLKCVSVEQTRSFYSNTLRFEVTDSADGTCTVMKEGGTIVFSEADLWDGPPHCTGTIYLFVDDVDRYHDEIREKVDLCWPLDDTSYGTREFAVKDCNGYILAFAQRRT